MILSHKCHLNGLILLWIACASLQSSDIRAVIIPSVAFTKTTKIKVSLVLNHSPPIGVTISANCFLEVVANFSDECGAGASCDDPDGLSTISRLKREPVAENLLPVEYDSGVSTPSNDSAETSLRPEKSVTNTLASLISERDMTTTPDQFSTKSHDLFSDRNAWTLDSSTLIFNDAVAAQDLVAVRSQLPTRPKVELLRIHCRLSGDDVSLAANLNVIRVTSALLVADLSPAVKVNWTDAAVLGHPLYDRPYPNPAYVEVSPCSCDLTRDACDTNCCCDQDCLSVDQDGFTCTEGLAGPQIVDHFCNLQTAGPPDWFSFLCVVQNNSGYLGTYYVRNPPILRSTKAFRLQVQRSAADLLGGPRRPSAESDTYKCGSPVLTAVGDAEQLGYLSLPMRTFNGQCTEASPLAFLVPQTSSCDVPVTTAACSEESLLSAGAYLDAGAQVVSRMDQQGFANVTLTYWCRTVADLGSPQILEECNPSDSKPFYNSQTGVCENAVLDVRYVFWWNGPEIENVVITIVLGNVSLTNLNGSTGDLYVTQQFQAEFWHSSQRDDDFNGTTNETFVRSGNPGYDLGRTLITGVPRERNGSHTSNTSDFAFVDINRTSSVRLLQPGLGGTCGNLGRPVVFGMNSYSGCQLKIPGQVAANCHLLRSTVLQYLCRFVPSTYVSKGGNPKLSNLADFVSIIREDTCNALNATFTMDDGSSQNSSQSLDGSEAYPEWDVATGACRVPSHLALTVLYTAAASIDGSAVYQVEGMRIGMVNSTWAKCRTRGGNSAGCWASGTNHSTVFVTSLVDFVETPADLNPSTKRFWIIQNSVPCSQESCWSEIGYPFKGADTGDARSYVTRWGLLLGAVTALILLLMAACW